MVMITNWGELKMDSLGALAAPEFLIRKGLGVARWLEVVTGRDLS